MDIVNEILNIILNLVQDVLWIAIPVFLFLYIWNHRMKVIKKEHLKSIKWKTLELRIPKEVLKSPKAMEQVFAALHATYSGKIKGYDKYMKGKVQSWMSFEMVGHNGGVYFYIRTPEESVNLVESAIFSQYSNSELHEVNDYTDDYPQILPNKALDLWGTDLILAKDDAYPIRTYEYFEDKDEEKRLDPISVITETMSKLKEDEIIWLQFLIKPTDDETNEWKKKGRTIIDKMMGREKKEEPKTSVFYDLSWGIYHWVRNFFRAFYTTLEWPTNEKKDAQPKTFSSLSSGEQDVVKAIEKKLAKLSFEVLIRFLFIGKKEDFDKSYINAILGAFKQFSIANMNSIKANSETKTSMGGWTASLFPGYKKIVEDEKKRAIYSNYKKRTMKPKSSVYSIEELATLFHIPSAAVTAPKMRRLEAKKGEPPEGLPVVSA